MNASHGRRSELTTIIRNENRQIYFEEKVTQIIHTSLQNFFKRSMREMPRRDRDLQMINAVKR
jgi:hypothetical protein